MSELLEFQKSLELRKGDLETLVSKLRAQSMLKLDLIVSSRHIRMDSHANVIIESSQQNEQDELSKLLNGLKISTKGKLVLQPFKTAHGQLKERLDIPSKYYDRMLSHPSLLKENVNHWMNEQDKNYFLRIFEDTATETGYLRTILSDKFFTLDNWDVLLATLEAVKSSGVNLQIDTCDISEQKMYVRFVCPNIEVDAPALLKNYRLPDGSIPNNPKICAGFVVSNSEIGCGRFYVAPRLLVLACRNGMIRKEDGFGKTHIGAKLEENQLIKFSEATKSKNLELVISQIKDAVKTFCSSDYLSKVVKEYEEKGSTMLQHPSVAVENMSKHYGLTDEKTQSVLDYFIKSADTSRFGAVQALTFYAHENADADAQYELECVCIDALDKMTTFDKLPK
jgi:hypothetical protein